MSDRIVFLDSKTVSLVLVNKSDAPIIQPWLNDMEVTQFLIRGAIPNSLEAEEEYLNRCYKTESDLPLGIWHKSKAKLIGMTGLHRINQIHQYATFGIFIGDKQHWGQGIGTEVLDTLCNYAFTIRNLRTIRLNVLASNPRAVRCYEKCGFREVGRYPLATLHNGVWSDEVLMVRQRD